MTSKQEVPAMKKRTTCRVCKSTDVVTFLELGNMPLAGGYLTEKEIKNEKFYPLTVYFCRRCTLVQLLDVVSPDVLFKDYRYLSSVSLSKHFTQYAKEITPRFLSAPDAFAVEIGCNDGVLLKPLQDLQVKTLGFEPATNVAKIATSRGIGIVNDFFTEKNAQAVAKQKGKADAVLANNVFAHIDDLDDIMRGVQALLKETGVFIFEVHYLVDLLEKLQYDTVYHEHLCYYSLHALMHLMKRFDMEIFDVERIPIHAGSIRVHVKRIGNTAQPITPSVHELIDLEKGLKIGNIDTYTRFSEKVKETRSALLDLLKKLRSEGKKIIGYGAPGRGNTLLNYCKIGKDMLSYVTDESPERYGWLIPGMHIPIVPPTKMKEDVPDYALMLAWSYMERIINKEKEYMEKGGKFIVPLPNVKIIP